MTAWPSVVWGAAVLRGLDDRGRREIEAAGALHEKGARDRVYREGEAADALFVVARGEVEVSRIVRGDRASRAVRKAGVGDTLGEEALLGPHAVRDGDASCRGEALLVEVPFVVLVRALVRAGGAELSERIVRQERRRVLGDRLRASGLAAGLDEHATSALLDAASFRELARGDVLFGPNDAHDRAIFVLEGVLAIQESEDDGRLAPSGYLSRGDVLAETRSRYGVTIAAQGQTSIVLFSKELIVPLLERAPFAGRGRLPEPRVARAGTTAQVVNDLYRVQIARSLLVIDQDACVRCGHCVWSCGNAHDDGAPRLTRRGDKLLLPVLGAARAASVPLLLPNSCQHCKNPACLKDCPTGAIVRDGRGEVKIREELCTGCGNCVRACPWENVRVVPRPGGGAFPDVAVKCDLCAGKDHGPACVSACPTEAIARIDPATTPIVGGASATASIVPRGAPAWPWIVLALALGFAGARVLAGALVSGAACAVVSGAALSYVAKKRARPRGGPSPTRPHYVAHLASGVLSFALVAGHALAAPHSASGRIALFAFGWLVATGAVAGCAYVALPRAASRLEREGRLPEDVPRAREQLERKIFRALSGRSDVVKKVYDMVLAPYRASRLGIAALVVARRSAREEERALGERIDALLEGRGADKRAGLDALVRLVVEERALRASAAIVAILRGAPALHVVGTGAFVLAAMVHAVLAFARSR